METLPVQNPVTPAATTAATSAAAPDANTNANAGSETSAHQPNPFSALLALQLGAGTPASAKPAPAATAAIDADDEKSKTDAPAPAAADPLAGLILPGWLPPAAAAPAAQQSPPASAVENGDQANRNIASGITTSALPDRQMPAPLAVATQSADAHASAPPAAVRADAHPHAVAEVDIAEIAIHTTEKTAPAGDISASANLPQQVAQPAAPAPSAAPAQHALEAPVGSPDWNTELGQKIVWMVGDKQQSAELRVNPPALGPLDIKLTMDGQSTTAVFTSPHSAVREAVESALPRLREVLADSGIMLGNASVTADTPRDSQAFTGQRHGARALDAPAADAAAAPVVTRLIRSTRGMIDLFA